MATDIATLAIKIENADVAKATTSVGSLEVASDKTEKAAGRLTRRMALLEIQAREMDASMKRGGAAMNALEQEARQMDAAFDKSRRAMHLMEVEAHQMNAAFDKSKFSIEGFATRLGVPAAAAAKLATALTAVGVAAAAVSIGRKIVQESTEAQNASAQLEAVIRSTGGAAGFTSAQLEKLAEDISRVSTFEDDAIVGAEGMLASFTNIRGDVFKGATQAVVDLATRMERDLPGAAILVGKALNDPVGGLGALSKAGIQVSDSQKALIKDLVATGRVAEAQNIILDELKRKFGGAGEAARNTLGGALQGLSNDWGNLFEVSQKGSSGMVTAINAIAAALPAVRDGMESFVTNTIVGWNNISAAFQQAGAALAIFDTTSGKTISEKIQEWRKLSAAIEDTRKAANDRVRSPAPPAPTSGGTTTAPGIDLGGGTDKNKLAETLNQQDAAIAKQKALNAAFGASASTLALLGNAYDAQAERAKNAVGHTAAETAALNKRTTAMQTAKDAAVLLAAAEDARKQVDTVRKGDSEAIRNAQQELELAGLSEEAARQRRIDMDAENALAAARVRFDEMTRNLDKERADIAAIILDREQKILTNTVNRVNAVRQVGHETATVTDQMEKQKKAQEEIERDMERRAKDLHRNLSNAIEGALTDISNRKNPLIALAEGFKRAMIHALAEALTTKIEAKVGDILGIKTPASKQEQAAKLMNEAADKMLRAGQQMNDSVPGDGLVGNTSDRKVLGIGVEQWKKAMGVGMSAYGGFQIGQGIGAATGDKVTGALGGAASGALAGAAIAGPWGAAIGGIAGAAGGLLGAADAAEQARKRLEEAKKAWNNLRDSLTAEFNKDDEAASIASLNAKYDEARKIFEASNPLGSLYNANEIVAGMFDGGTKRAKEYADELSRLGEEQKKRILQIQEEIAIIRGRQKEDYQQRLDEATPGNERQEAIDAFNRKADRELEDLKRSFGPVIDAQEAETYAIAERAINQEKYNFALKGATDALGAFTTSVNNAPTGFKIEPYIQEFAKAAPRPGTQPINPLPVPVNPFVPPTSPLTPSAPAFSRTATTTTATPAPMSITIQSGAIVVQESKTPQLTADAIMSAVLTKVDQARNSTQGLNGTRSAALDTMPAPLGAVQWRS